VDIAEWTGFQRNIDLHISMGVRPRHAGKLLPPQNKPSMRGLVKYLGSCHLKSDYSIQRCAFFKMKYPLRCSIIEAL
jgi:hypothetical protein